MNNSLPTAKKKSPWAANKWLPSILLMAPMLFLSCQRDKSRPLITISTPFGDMEVILHDSAPKHKEAFLQYCEQASADSRFYRLLPSAFVQGEIRTEKPIANLRVPSETSPVLFHRKGALVAGKPLSKGNFSWDGHFYIAVGRKYSREELLALQREHNYRKLAPVAQRLMAEDSSLKAACDALLKRQDTEGVKDLVLSYQKTIEERFGKADLHRLTEEQLEAYTQAGGLPEFDGRSAVFGQIISGLNILDSLYRQPSNEIGQPISPLNFQIRVEYLDDEAYQKFAGHSTFK